MPTNAVEIRGLVKSYPGFTLGPLELTVPEGAIYGFVGPNGSGKTTTMDLIFGMGGKNAGSITVLGLDHIRDEVAMKQQVGYLSPTLTYSPWKRVGKAIQFVRGFYPTWDEAYCDRLLKTFRIDRRQRILTLSTGARVKFALALVLAWRPKLMVLDEPTLGLNAISRQELFSELLAAVRDGDRSIFISSHGLTDLERFADHIGMIKKGRLLFEGATSEVIERYRMVDFIAPAPVDFAAHPGFVVQTNEGARWRVLLDLRQASLDWIKARGAMQIADAPVTLEELFVALGRD